MQRLFDWFMRTFQKIPDWTHQHRIKVWLGFFVILAALTPGIMKFQLDLSEESFFQENDPVKKAFERFRHQFGGDESIYLVYEAKDGDVFSPTSLSAVRTLQEELLNYRLALEPGESSPLDHIVDITSLINVSYLEASDDSLLSRQFIGNRIPNSPEDVESYRQLAQKHPDYPYLYLSKDSRYGAILIRTDFKTQLVKKDSDETENTTDDSHIITNSDDFLNESADLLIEDDFDVTDVSSIDLDTPVLDSTEEYKFERVDMDEYSFIMAEVRKVIDKEQYTQHLTFYASGTPPLHAIIWDDFMPQIDRFMMLTLVIVIMSLLILFRSISAVLWPTLIIILSSYLMVAILGTVGLVMNLMINVTVLLILVVGVADAVHILSGYLFFRQQGQPHREALRSAYAKAGMAIFLTSVTTAVGMLALLTVPLTPIQNFGISCALGVFLAFIITVIMLPLMLEIWRPAKRLPTDALTEDNQSEKPDIEQANHLHWIQKALQSVEHWATQAPWLNISVFTVLTAFFLYGTTLIRVDSNQIQVFSPDHPIRAAYELVDNIMGGTQNLEVYLESEQDGTFQDPQVLNMMEELQHFLENDFEEVVLTRSLVNIVKDANQSLHGGNPEYYSIPQDGRQLQQTLFLFNNANPTDRRRVVSDDYSQAHITINSRNTGTEQGVQLFNVTEEKIKTLIEPLKEQYPNLKVTVTGGMALLVKMMDYISWSQITGFGLALLIISLILLFIFGSIRVGIIALFPNLFPLIVVFGSMGYLNIPVDVDTLIVAPLMIGIVVDDTIHFLTHYRDEIIKSNGNIIEAIRQVFREVGQAITFTSLILALAFFSFLGLDHQGLSSFGLLSSMAIIAALAAELFLLPALLMVTRTTFKRHRMKLTPASSV